MVPELAKIDMARAFCNLRVDPGDACTVTYSLIRRLHSGGHMGWLVLVFDTIAHLMQSEGYKMFPYIDDYILVTSEKAADTAF